MGYLSKFLGLENPTYSESAQRDLEAQARGAGPNLAGQLFQTQAGQIAGQQAGLMRSTKGISPGLGARTGAMLGAQAMQEANAGSAAMALRQQIEAQRMLAEQSAAAARQNAQMEGQLVGGLASGAGAAFAGPLGAWLARKGASALTQGEGYGALSSPGTWVKSGMNLGPEGFADGGEVPRKEPPPEPKWQPPEYPLPEAGQLGYEGENAKVKIRPLDRPPATGGSLPLYDYLGVGPKQKMAAGGSPVFMSDGTVPGQARVAGDSLQNDTVDAKLSPGEIVIPRSIAQSPNAPEEAASFVAHLIRRGGGGYDKVARAKGRKMADGGKVDETAEEAPPAEAAPSTESVVPSNAATRFVQHLSKLLGVKDQGVIRKRQELYEDAEKKTKDE